MDIHATDIVDESGSVLGAAAHMPTNMPNSTQPERIELPNGFYLTPAHDNRASGGIEGGSFIALHAMDERMCREFAAAMQPSADAGLREALEDIADEMGGWVQRKSGDNNIAREFRDKIGKRFASVVGNDQHRPALVEAATAFIEKIGRCHEHHRYVAVWTEAHRVLGPYNGPTYEHELIALRQALATVAPQPALPAWRDKLNECEAALVSERKFAEAAVSENIKLWVRIDAFEKALGALSHPDGLLYGPIVDGPELDELNKLIKESKNNG